MVVMLAGDGVTSVSHCSASLGQSPFWTFPFPETTTEILKNPPDLQSGWAFSMNQKPIKKMNSQKQCKWKIVVECVSPPGQDLHFNRISQCFKFRVRNGRGLQEEIGLLVHRRGLEALQLCCREKVRSRKQSMMPCNWESHPSHPHLLFTHTPPPQSPTVTDTSSQN